MEESILNNLSDSELSELVTKSQQILNGRKRMAFNKDVCALVEAIRKFSEKHPKAKFTVGIDDGYEIDVLEIVNTLNFNDLLDYFYLSD